MKGILKNNVDIFKKLFTIPNNWQNVLYVHTPFCLQKCKYCIYASIIPSGQEQMDEFYNNVLPAHIEQYRDIFENVKFDQVYFGGGTPSIAAPETLEKIYNLIPNFKDIPIKMSESSPYTITDEHIELFDKYKFSYISLGVQTLSPRVLEAQNRLVVPLEKLQHIYDRLNNYSLVGNADLIFFLDTGHLEDMVQSRKDLDYTMGKLRPRSITIHSDYYADKSIAKQEAILELIDQMINRYPEYSCVNSLLDKSDIEYDMLNGAEYRLMRDHNDFMFYMLSRIPGSPCHGYNVLAIGANDTFVPESNYFYVLDFMDKYAYREVAMRSSEISLDFGRVRKKLGLSHPEYFSLDRFFKDQKGQDQFKDTLKSFRLPFHDFKNVTNYIGKN
jgi:coproporphyrinogen III oxidase-like Fe-S oxidoreductase